MESYAVSFAAPGRDPLAGAADQLGHELSAVGALLTTRREARELLVGAIEFVRPVFSDLFGFPGTPKANVDLRPSGAVFNLRQWERNPHTMQFVTPRRMGYRAQPLAPSCRRRGR